MNNKAKLKLGIKDIDKFLKLEEGWDEEGAHKISQSVGDSAKKLLTKIYSGIELEETCVSPVCNGGIDFYWGGYEDRMLLYICEEKIDFCFMDSSDETTGATISDSHIEKVFMDLLRENFAI